MYSLYKTNIETAKSTKHDYRIKNSSIDKDELAQTNRSRSEGSTRCEREPKRLKDTSSDITHNKITIRDNYETRRKDLIKNSKKRIIGTQNENQLIYTFRENSIDNTDDCEKIASSVKSTHHYTRNGNPKEKAIKMSRKDLYTEKDRFSTITRDNESFSQTLLSLKKANVDFHNTGKCIENMNSSDLNIMKSFTKGNDTGELSGAEINPPSSKHRSISTRRISRTDRRDGVKSKKRKPPHLIAEELGIEKDSQGFQAFTELQKKYNKLKRHYRKERKYHTHKIGNIIEQNKSLVHKVKRLESKLAQ